MHELLFDFISKYITLNEDEKEVIKSLDIFRVVKKGTVLLKEGEVSKDGYFVLKGCLRTYYVIGGEEKNTGFYTEMEGVTPQCVRTNEPSEYYVSSMEDSIISVSTPEMEVEVFEKFPRFESLCRILSEELLAKEQLNFDSFRTQSAEQRYLSLTKNRPDLIQRIPQRHLASYLGITPESLSRLRARIQKKE